ncbi:hypothetical protein NG895_02730 [Aeoliella sp. ICT_H6.2]|uniref:Uncharacterized protein n=1 Tax=Aeoliella straminimaris TaxID=2954799 RepID=A0A9X2F6Y3_9BACT|nr:hypothetical protein [Aeoliella straminimaris]MCO6042813.1 hypothetical protein [Aeoliella straminimaris]
MNAPELNVAVPSSASSTVTPVTRAGPAATARCLVVTADSGHATLLESSAGEEGWSVDVCECSLQALRLAFRLKFQLAVIDLQSVTDDEASRNDLEQLARDLAQNHVPLLVINGDPDNPLGEFAARQLGVWVYLPGLGEDVGLESMFREARLATEKLARDAATVSEQTNQRRLPAG